MNTLGIGLKRSLLFHRLRWSFVYLAWIHICMDVAMLKFTSTWHISMLYVRYLCPSLSPLSHGSMLYSSSHDFLFLSWIYLLLVYSHESVTFFYESKVLMYYRCLLDDTLWSSWLLPQSDNLFSQSSCLSYPSKPHALGEILLYPNHVTNMLWDP